MTGHRGFPMRSCWLLPNNPPTMSSLFRVLYDFRAEEEGELSVRAGDVVSLVGASRFSVVEKGGWGRSWGHGTSFAPLIAAWLALLTPRGDIPSPIITPPPP